MASIWKASAESADHVSMSRIASLSRRPAAPAPPAGSAAAEAAEAGWAGRAPAFRRAGAREAAVVAAAAAEVPEAEVAAAAAEVPEAEVVAAAPIELAEAEVAASAAAAEVPRAEVAGSAAGLSPLAGKGGGQKTLPSGTWAREGTQPPGSLRETALARDSARKARGPRDSERSEHPPRRPREAAKPPPPAENAGTTATGSSGTPNRQPNPPGNFQDTHAGTVTSVCASKPACLQNPARESRRNAWIRITPRPHLQTTA